MNNQNNNQNNKIIIVIHGGAGTLQPDQYSAFDLQEYKNALKHCLLVGFNLLKQGGSAVDATRAAVVELENCPLFNAGVGSVFNARGKIELDASIMDGKTLEAGAVTGVTMIKNPIEAAYFVMKKTPHCLLAGAGAQEFVQNDIDIVEPEYFFTQKRWDQWQQQHEGSPFGTVGAVAKDSEGNLSSATSTGGLTFKLPGRVSDSAIIGAGTYANNKTCAISTTGKGDYFIRHVTAKDISDLMEYQGLSLTKAAEISLKKIVELGGEGGLIGVDNEGNFVMTKSTSGMFRGMMDSTGQTKIEIF